MPKKLLIILPTTILVLVQNSIFFYRLITTPSGRIFLGTQSYYEDYNVYSHTIAQGTRGRWTVVDKYTSEPHQPSLFHIQYLLLGKFFGPPLNLILKPFTPYADIYTPTAVYLFSRIALEIALLIAVWYFLKEVFPDPPKVSTSSATNDVRRGGQVTFLLRLSAWLLILYSDVWPQNLSQILDFKNFWNNLTPAVGEPEVLSRFYTNPHFLTGYLALFIILIFFLKLIQNHSTLKKSLLICSAVSFLAAWTDPASVITAAAACGICSTIYLVIKLNIRKILPFLLFTLTVTVSALPAYVYLTGIRTQEPWLTIAQFDHIQTFYLPPRDLSLAFGIPFLIAPIGLFLLFKYTRHKSYTVPLLLLSWIIAFALLFYFLAPMLQINRLRLFHPPLFVAVDILAAYAIYHLSVFLRLRVPVYFYCLLFTILIILPTLPSALTTYRSEISLFSDHGTLIYPTTSQADAYTFLRDHTPEDSVVAALYEAGSQIPAFTGNRSYAGNLTETLNYASKAQNLNLFFAGFMTASQAKDFLNNAPINYIYWGYQEKAGGGNISQYPFLQQVYGSPQVTIFSVAK